MVYTLLKLNLRILRDFESAKNKDNMDNLDRYITTEAKRFIDNEGKNIELNYKNWFEIRIFWNISGKGVIPPPLNISTIIMG